MSHKNHKLTAITPIRAGVIAQRIQHNSRVLPQANAPTTKPIIMNKISITGILSIVVSGLIHLSIATTIGISFSEIFPLYFMALFITLTGVGYHFEGKIQHANTGKSSAC